MPSLDSLPEECLLHIISFTDQRASSLRVLLLTSRTLFRLAAPILYRDPFRLLEPSSTRRSKLLRLLLACSPEFRRSCPATLPPRPSADYLSFYRCHDEMLIQNFIKVAIPIQGPSSAHGLGTRQGPADPLDETTKGLSSLTLTETETEAETLAETQKESSSLTQGTQPPFSQHHLDGPSSSTLRPPRRQPIVNAATIQKLVHTTLLTHTPHQLTMLAYSINHLGALQQFIPLLSGLTQLVILRRPHPGKLSEAVAFIEQHRQCHPSALQEIQLKLSMGVDRTDFSPLIMAMGQPRVIDVTGWSEAERFIDSFPAKECRVLLLRQVNHGGNSDPMPISGATLAKFRNLRKVRMPVYDPAAFSWANPFGQGSSSSSSPPSSSLSAFPSAIETTATATTTTMLTSRMPQTRAGLGLEQTHLQSAELSGHDHVIIPAARDIVSGFRETLQCLDLRSKFGVATSLALGWDWILPQLTILRIRGMVAATFDLTSLRYCTSLKQLTLNIGKVTSDWPSVQKARALAENFPTKVTSLELAGWWYFKDEDLTRTLLPRFQQLRELNLMWCKEPGYEALMELIRRLNALRWIAVSTVTEQERDAILQLRSELGRRQDLEVDIHVLMVMPKGEGEEGDQ